MIFLIVSDMTDPFDGLSSNQEHSNIDNTSTSNIPISDFRRNEARPILADDGNCFIFFIYCIKKNQIRILIRST
jgi:hypothetical protein